MLSMPAKMVVGQCPIRQMTGLRVSQRRTAAEKKNAVTAYTKRITAGTVRNMVTSFFVAAWTHVASAKPAQQSTGITGNMSQSIEC
jgi:hypothetical protein